MKWNKTARMLAVAGLTLASTVAWSAPNPPPNGLQSSLPNQPNPIGSTPAVGVVGATLSATGGGGGPSGTVDAYSAQPNTNGPQTAYDLTVPATPVAIGGGGLAGTSHDFISGSGSSGVAAAAGLCTFCHTPHKASSTLLLWNHTLSNNTFQWDVAATTAGTALPGFVGNAYNGPSAKCLSCHDGSVAIGDVGWFGEGAATLSSFKVGQAGAGKAAGGDSKQVGKSGNMSGNHPVAIPYPLNGLGNVYNGSTTGAQLATNDWELDPTANNIRLYSDVGNGVITGKATPGTTGIECSSCHDPHNKASKDDFFLRGNLTGGTKASGYICLQCHKK